MSLISAAHRPAGRLGRRPLLPKDRAAVSAAEAAPRHGPEGVRESPARRRCGCMPLEGNRELHSAAPGL